MHKVIASLLELSEKAGLAGNPRVEKALRMLSLGANQELAREVESFLLAKNPPSVLADPFFPYPDSEPEIELGILPNERPAGIGTEDLFTHQLVVGSSGAGKSNLILHLISKLVEQGIPFFIADWKDEYSGLIKNYANVYPIPYQEFFINPLIPPPGMEPKKWLLAFCNLFCDSFSLMIASKSHLLTHLHQLYEKFGVYKESSDEGMEYPTLQDLALSLQRSPDYYRGKRFFEYLETLRNRVDALLITLGDSILVKQSLPLQELIKTNLILRLKGLEDLETQGFVVALLLYWIFSYKINNRVYDPHILIFDEGNRIFRQNPNPTLLDHLVAVVRAFREELVVSTQDSNISEAIISNSSTKVLLRMGNIRDCLKFGQSAGLSPEQIKILPELEVGQAVLRAPNQQPVLISIPFIPIQAVEEEEIQARKQEHPVLSEFKPIKEKEAKVTLDEELMEFLRSVETDPYIPLTQRYVNLGLSSFRGNTVKQFLLSHGYIREASITTGRRGCKPKFLELTKLGKVSLDQSQPYQGRGAGIEHRYYSQLIKEHFIRQQYEVELEQRVNGRYVDLVATRSGRYKLGVEIIINPTDEPERVKDLEPYFHRILLCCRNEQVKSAVEQKLRERFGSIPEKVHLKLLIDFTRQSQ